MSATWTLFQSPSQIGSRTIEHEPMEMDAELVAHILRQQADRIEEGTDPICPTEVVVCTRYSQAVYRVNPKEDE